MGIGYRSCADNSICHDLQKVRLMTSDELDIGVNNPLCTNGDSVYVKDINSSLSTIGTFTGDIESLFNDYTDEISDTSATNPKTYTIHFSRPIASDRIGLGSLTGDFSNVKIMLKDLSGTVRVTVDNSGDNTKYTSNVYAFAPNVFIEMVVEFHTADAVKISGMYVPKSITTTSQIQALKPDGTLTTVNATAGGNFKVSLEEFDDAFKESPLPVREENSHAFINRHLFQRQGTFLTANAAMSAGDRTITTNSTTGFSEGDSIFIHEGTKEECDIFQITSLVVDTSITVTRPICNDYTVASTIELVEDNMAVDGSATTQVYTIKPPIDQVWDIQRCIVFMKTDKQPDMDYFGDVPGGLANGVVFRFNPGDDTVFKTLAQWRDNGDMAQDMYDVAFDDSAGPAGFFGVRGRWSFNKFGYSPELDGSVGDSLDILIQDDLTVSVAGSGIAELEIKVQGHVDP